MLDNNADQQESADEMPVDQETVNRKLGGMAMREKHWDEIDADGKIERMRDVVKVLQGRNKRLANQVSELMNHEHCQDGRVVVSINRFSDPETEIPFGYRGDKNEWF